MTRQVETLDDILTLAVRELSFLKENLNEFPEVRGSPAGAVLLTSLDTGLRSASALQEKARAVAESGAS